MRVSFVIFFLITTATWLSLSDCTGKFEEYLPDEDGYPKIMKLYGDDAANFRKWFIAIALDMVENPHKGWKTRDCAGFVFYVLKEALKRHDAGWFKKTGYKGPVFEDVKKYNYPSTPLGVDIFFDGKRFVSYVTGYHLLHDNVNFISKERKDAKPGDLIFYFHPEDFFFPYHVMIYTGNGFVYHTGPIREGEGEVRYVRYDDMFDAEMSWVPSPLNPHFLGYFRLKILGD